MYYGVNFRPGATGSGLGPPIATISVFKTRFQLQMPVEERHNATYNPLCEVFPRIASCEYVRYGVAGIQETRSALCILGLNMVNDKVGKPSCFIWHLIS